MKLKNSTRGLVCSTLKKKKHLPCGLKSKLKPEHFFERILCWLSFGSRPTLKFLYIQHRHPWIKNCHPRSKCKIAQSLRRFVFFSNIFLYQRKCLEKGSSFPIEDSKNIQVAISDDLWHSSIYRPVLISIPTLLLKKKWNNSASLSVSTLEKSSFMIFLLATLSTEANPNQLALSLD